MIDPIKWLHTANAANLRAHAERLADEANRLSEVAE